MYAQNTISLTQINKNDFGRLLRLKNIKFKEADQYYYQVGTVKHTEGWVLHVSVIKNQITSLLNTVLPLLIKEKIAFKIVRDVNIASTMNDGLLGNIQIGKILCLYPENKDKANDLVQALITLTLPFTGPAVSTDAKLSGNVYANYEYLTPGTHELPVPFRMPKGQQWCFQKIAQPAASASNIIHSSYLIREVLKTDTKGNVLKTLWLNGFWFKNCILKEGLHDMLSDNHGRDMRDRLRWQFTLQQNLQKHLRVPKPYELFEEKGNVYISMEIIKGKLLQEVISIVNENVIWPALTLDKKNLLLNYLIQLLNTVNILHNVGIIHRDISPTNFMIDRNNNLIMIDFELAYDYKRAVPSPPFDAGINCFTSPERSPEREPTIQEDVYSLGAMMFLFFTNMTPKHSSDSNHLAENLNYLIGDAQIVQLIIKCLDTNPNERPSLNTIVTQIKEYQNNLKASQNIRHPENRRPSEIQINHLITDSLRALSTPLFTGSDKIWHSSIIENGKQIQPGIYSGISGVLYTLAIAKKEEISVKSLSSIYSENYRYLTSKYLSQNGLKRPSGLFTGTAGVALYLSKGMESKLTPSTSENRAIIRDYLDCLSLDANLATGAAGNGIAALQCDQFLDEQMLKKALQDCLNILIKTQQYDGSWINNGEKKTGFSEGVAGIIIFLLEYYHRYKDEESKASATKALNWLCKKMARQNGNPIWPISDKRRNASPWLTDGFSGIALCMIRAYKILQDDRYKNLVEGTLRNIPFYLVVNNLSIAKGICGIGQVYLEAAEIFNNNEWRERADWIAQVIIRSGYSQADGSRYWAVDSAKSVSADLMTGNCGVIHFLMRYLYPGKISFPLLP
ncbi:protein kinase/lanthionine synthetase C family protein [Dawidia soli]|uniref:Protein kinase/lanthionine synthetase C family protein n=1 Tax=Dawidia soli TaxID=2782352 RepID=A0AAP2D7W8_9BACT|nr:protein kinase/lanthionine synthetase C family protein [Dawidia soli]MBT1687106.1 protein kinase/lanthionine synthetase C family protein [Dawidia soli]